MSLTHFDSNVHSRQPWRAKIINAIGDEFRTLQNIVDSCTVKQPVKGLKEWLVAQGLGFVSHLGFSGNKE